MKVSEIMTHSVLAVTPETPVSDVITLITENQIAGVPVVTQAGEVVGMISEIDILRRMFPDYCEFINDVIGAMEYDYNDLKVGELRHLKAGDIMRSGAITVPADAAVMKACGLMVSHKVRRLPVVDPATDKLVGIVSQGQVFREILRLAVGKDA